MRPSLLSVAVLLAVLTGCAGPATTSVYQNGTIDALLDGNFDGEVTFREVRRRGDFGIGTFDAVDGEMLAVDGKYYRLRADGRVYPVTDDEKTPLAIVTFYRARETLQFGGQYSYLDLQHALDSFRKSDGRACAVRLDGRFSKVRVRSVGRQNKPYPPLVDVVKTQSEWELHDVEGTLVGFWFPPELRHVNVPGWHFHFITRDRQRGGHVLDLALTRGEGGMQELDEVHVAMNRSAARIRPTTDRSHDLEKVEK